MKFRSRHASFAAFTLLIAAPALAQTDGFPVEFNSGFPSLTGQGAVQGTFFGTPYSNQYLSFGFPSGTFNPSTLQVNLFGSGNTGGGIGFGQGDASINTQTSLISALEINGAAHSSGSAPGDNTGTYGEATAAFSFEVTSAVMAQWTSTGESTLLLGGIPFSPASSWTLLLPAGTYTARAYAHGVSTNPGSGGSFYSDSANFKLEIGVPAPAAVSLLGLAGLAAMRRRR